MATWVSILLLLISRYGVAQQAQWAKFFGGPSGSQGIEIAADAAGNVYSIGQYAYNVFTGPVDLDLGPGVVAFTQPENTGSSYISKLNPNGNLIWVRSFTNSSVGSAGVQKLVLLPNGDFLIAGVFGGTVDFNLGAGVFNLTSNSTNNANSDARDFFIAKYNASGNFLWVKSFPCLSNGVNPNFPTTNGVGGLSFDNQNNILFTATFKGQVDMDPGSSEHWIDSFGNYNAFWVKLTSTGDFIQGQHVANGSNASTSIISDEVNNIYLHGAISQSVYFGEANPENILHSHSWSDSYILKMNSIGERIWLNKIHGPQYGYGGSTDISVDDEGNVYATGNILRDSLYFKSTYESQFLLKSNSFTETGANGFVTKIDSTGHFLWIKQLASDSEFGVSGRKIECDSISNVYVCGQFADSADFDYSGSGAFSFAAGDYSSFVLKLDSEGNFIRTSVIDGDLYVNCIDFSLDEQANIYFTGFFNVVNFDMGFPWGVMVGTGMIDFDPGPDTLALIGLGNGPETVFVAKWNQCSAGTTTINETVCDDYTWNNQTYSQSGIYSKSFTTALGCDSIAKLNLTVLNNSQTSQNVQICAGETFTIGNQTLTQSGIYETIFTAQNGCDSLVTLQLVVLPEVSSSQSISLCAGESFTINGETYTEEGIYQTILSDMNGCDSTVTVNLTVNTLDSEILVSNNVFTAINTPQNAQLQWLNCDDDFAIITGEVNPTFIPSSDGYYALETSSGNCSDTSNCVLFSSVGLHSITSNQFKIYPIPADEILIIESELLNLPIRIFDAQGKLVFEAIKSNKQMEIDVRSFQSGLYFIQSENKSKPFTILHNR